MNEDKNDQNIANQPVNTPSFSAIPEGPFLQQRNKPSKWRYFFATLGILQLLGVALFLFTMSWAIQQAQAGVSGTEFIGLLLYMTLVPAMGFIALINLVTLPIYIIKLKPRGKWLVLAVVSLIISSALFIYGAYNAYQLRVAVPAQHQEFSEKLAKDSAQRQQKFTADNANPEITKEEAIALLKDCKLRGFYYTKEHHEEHGTSPATSKTGVVLTKIDGEPYRISIADRLVEELVPIAREAQKTCNGPQFWHDGFYEDFKDGNWYFKGEIVKGIDQ